VDHHYLVNVHHQVIMHHQRRLLPIIPVPLNHVHLHLLHRVQLLLHLFVHVFNVVQNVLLVRMHMEKQFNFVNNVEKNFKTKKNKKTVLLNHNTNYECFLFSTRYHLLLISWIWFFARILFHQNIYTYNYKCYNWRYQLYKLSFHQFVHVLNTIENLGTHAYLYTRAHV
jgi:hypothetical protein